MGDGRWRCEVCGAGERCKHNDDCVECIRCEGLGWVSATVTDHYKNIIGGEAPTARRFQTTCKYCKGEGRIAVPGSLLDRG